VARSSARETLGLDRSSRVILAFGAVRGYKRLPTLVQAFRRLTDDDVRLVIAGRALDDRDEADVRAAADGDSRIHLWLRHISDDEVAPLFSACDVFVLPSVEQLTSGSLIAAMEFGLAVVASDQPQVRHLCGTDGAVLFAGDDEMSLTDALRRALAVDVGQMGRRNMEQIRRTTATDAVDVLVDAYRTLIGNRDHPRRRIEPLDGA
jgi:glycosyltransferase involved in cell wall biosynthesis